MSVQSYIEDLQKEKNISYRQLAKETGVSYQTLLSFKSGKVNELSNRILEKLAHYENINMEELLFKIKLDPSITNICNENTLFYLCKQICNNYRVTIHIEEENPFGQTPLYYAGSYEKKTGNSLSYVEDWESLKRDHWMQVCQPKTIKTNDKYYLSHFKNKETYYMSVLSFGFLRICNLENKNIVNYDLLFSNPEEMEYVQTILPKKSKIKVQTIYQPISDILSGYVPEIFLEDIQDACNQILELEKTMLIDQQNSAKEKLYKASKIIFQSKTFKNTFKHPERAFTIQKMYNTYFNDLQGLLNFVDGKLHDLTINLPDNTTIKQLIDVILYSIYDCCKTIKKEEYVNILILLNSIQQ